MTSNRTIVYGNGTPNLGWTNVKRCMYVDGYPVPLTRPKLQINTQDSTPVDMKPDVDAFTQSLSISAPNISSSGKTIKTLVPKGKKMVPKGKVLSNHSKVPKSNDKEKRTKAKKIAFWAVYL